MIHSSSIRVHQRCLASGAIGAPTVVFGAIESAETGRNVPIST
jgi:hypothetical protein